MIASIFIESFLPDSAPFPQGLHVPQSPVGLKSLGAPLRGLALVHPSCGGVKAAPSHSLLRESGLYDVILIPFQGI